MMTVPSNGFGTQEKKSKQNILNCTVLNDLSYINIYISYISQMVAGFYLKKGGNVLIRIIWNKLIASASWVRGFLL